MKTSVQNDIKIPKSGFKRNRFNWSHDINTTFGWGDVQPTECKLLVPGSKTVVKNRGLVRFAPLVSPTFGRVKYKSFSQFVPIEDVYPNFASMLTQEPKSTASKVKVCKNLLNCNLSSLSQLCFLGARATLYFAAAVEGQTLEESAAKGQYITWYRNDTNSIDSQWVTYFNHLQTYSNNMFTFETDTWNHFQNQSLPLYKAVVLDLSKAGSLYSGNGLGCIRLSAQNLYDLCPVARDYEPDYLNLKPVLRPWQKEVTFENADFVLEGKVVKSDNSDYICYAIAFEFSDFGKRFRKILQGCGYQLNLTTYRKVSMLPLIAQYKAYFDVFGLELYKSWESTYCYKFIKMVENDFVENFDLPLQKGQNVPNPDSNNINGVWYGFLLLELMDEWYTERPDFYGAHTEKLAVSPVLDTSKFISVNSLGQLKEGANIDVLQTTDSNNLTDLQTQNNSINADVNLPYINQLQHGFVDATLLQRMTRWINKYSVLGRAFDKIMRAFNLGKYLDAVDSKFIGNTDKMLTISDVVSLADTAGATLGEFGGKGIEYFQEDKLIFENDSFGYWITLSCIVPESGYTQNMDLTLDCISKGDIYQADFDAIGSEASVKENLIMSQSISGVEDLPSKTISHTFGFVPRQSKWKVHKNLVNGDFNRHGLRSVYLPFTLDKQLNINDYSLNNHHYERVGSNVVYSFSMIDKSVKAYQAPCAGNWARTPTKYRWLGHFDRIFRKFDEELTERDDYTIALNQLVGWFDFSRDNFMFHCISDMTCWAPMKPIEESYGIDQEDENPNQNGVEYVVKA